MSQEMFYYNQEIFDTHVHFWTYDGTQSRSPVFEKLAKYLNNEEKFNELYKVVPIATQKFIGETDAWFTDFLPKDLLEQSPNCNVKYCIHVEAGWFGDKADEVFWEQKLANTIGYPHIILGSCNLKSVDCEQVLLKMKEASNFRGVRVSLARHDNPEVWSFGEKDLARNNDWRRGVSKLHSLGLILELWCYSHQIPDVIEIAELNPSLSIILNHFGTPVNIQDQHVLEEWKQNLKMLSKCSNVIVKLSGLGMPVVGFPFSSTNPPVTEIVQLISPIVLYIIQTFGFDRIVFGSNFPVDKASFSYLNLVQALKTIFSENSFSIENQRKIFFSNAIKLYALSPESML